MSIQKKTVMTFERFDVENSGTRYRCHRCGRVGVFFKNLDRLFRATQKHMHSCSITGDTPTGIEKTELQNLLP